ncbi:MAG TPA: helix-turn-helix transcriptional regulator [Opitutaceae bacterium]
MLVCRSHHVEDPVEQLSDREMEVFELIGDGYTTRQIDKCRNLSVKTIDSYREHLKMKLHVADAPRPAASRNPLDEGESSGLIRSP